MRIQKCTPIFWLFLAVQAASPQGRQGQPEFEIGRANQPPAIDGVLDDPAWSVEPLPLGEWFSYSPLRGEKALQRTEVRMTYDDRNLYFAFHCFDTEPGRIRTTITRRDTAFNDDWIAISLDSTAAGQTAYHLFSNPSGMQMDALNTSASGEQFEADLIWDSAGRIGDDGYTIEVRLPLQSIRFQGGSTVPMGIMFFRRISRTGVSFSSPEMPPGLWVFDRHARAVLHDLKQPRLVELLPSVTYSRNQTRSAPDRWNPATGNADVGLSAKYGITGAITLDATVNPDFSQVESDAFQVQVNQRFPIFFSEKRPFFMEGMGLFNVAGGGNMRSAVHTRRIVDPSWGAKLTGSAGRASFGLLSAGDDTPDKQRLFNIGRANYGLGGANYIGLFLSNVSHAGRSNSVIASDLYLKRGRGQEISTTFMATGTRIPGQLRGSTGNAAQISYTDNSRRAFSFGSQIEHYDREFQMDTAFYNRTGFTSAYVFADVNFYPADPDFWIKKITGNSFNKIARDRIQNADERFAKAGLFMNFTRQGFFQIEQSWGRDPWLGREFQNGRTYIGANAQLFRWLNLGGKVDWGWAAFYDAVSPFQGRSTSRNVDVTLQPNSRVNQNISYNGVRFTRASNGAEVFDVHIVNSRTTYQFNKHFLTRALFQYDSSERRLLTDLLASYEVAPGTVFHAGYGSLTEKRDFGRYLTVSRGLFFKASYLHRF